MWVVDKAVEKPLHKNGDRSYEDFWRINQAHHGATSPQRKARDFGRLSGKPSNPRPYCYC